MPSALPRSDDDPASARTRALALQALLQAAGGAPVRFVETHISWLLIGRDEVFKLKRPLRLDFIDCGTLARRRACAREELRVNARLAPELYLGVVDVRATPAGPRFGGREADGPVVDVAVRMRRFADGALWSERLAAGTLRPRHVDRLAQRLAAFHGSAAVAPSASGWATPATLATMLARTAAALDAWQAAAPAGAAADWTALRPWVQAQCAALAPLFDARRAAGRVREGHGDLHLANLLAFDDGDATAFDGIDFDPSLRWIDVLHDLAFAVMDLLAHGADAFAWRLLNAWLDATGDHEGLPLLRFYLVQRALVRAQVGAMAQADGRQPRPAPADYLALARRLADGADPRLAITHGLPGSGKSVLAQALLEAAGAVRVRSDVERKRLHGLDALASSRGGPDLYAAEAGRRTYDRLDTVATLALAAGWPVIVDAAFLRADERRRFAALAAARRCPFTVLDCRAPPALLAERLRERQARGDDPSEADEAVLARLAAVAEPLADDEAARALVVDAGDGPGADELARRWRAARCSG